MNENTHKLRAVARLLHDMTESLNSYCVNRNGESGPVLFACKDLAETMKQAAHKAQTLAFMVDSSKYFYDHVEGTIRHD